MREFFGGGITVLPNLGMTIREVERKTKIMAVSRVGRKIDPDLGLGIGHKEPIINAPLILIQQHP